MISRVLPTHPNAPYNQDCREKANDSYHGAGHGVGVLEAHNEKGYKECYEPGTQGLAFDDVIQTVAELTPILAKHMGDCIEWLMFQGHELDVRSFPKMCSVGFFLSEFHSHARRVLPLTISPTLLRFLVWY